jgi:hypothetical protein
MPGAKIIVAMRKTTARPDINNFRHGHVSLITSAPTAAATSRNCVRASTLDKTHRKCIVIGGLDCMKMPGDLQIEFGINTKEHASHNGYREHTNEARAIHARLV